jgi:hypothetical protein
VRLLHIAKPQLSNEAGSEHGCQCYNKFWHRAALLFYRCTMLLDG